MAKVATKRPNIVDEAVEFASQKDARRCYVDTLSDELRDAINELADRHASGAELNITKLVEFFRSKGAKNFSADKFYRQVQRAKERLQQRVK
jgi:hypothetical protein